MDHDSAPLLANGTDVSVPIKEKPRSNEPSINGINIQTPPYEDAPATRDPAEYYEFSFRGRCSFRLRLVFFNVFLTIMTVLSSLMMATTLPLFSASMVTESSTDEYPVLFFTALWFPIFFLCLVVINKLIDPAMSLKSTTSHRVMALVGGMNSLNGVLVVYASDPDRTSPQLQAILGTSVIPFTVICRYIILRKGDKNNIISTQASHNIIIATTAIVIKDKSRGPVGEAPVFSRFSTVFTFIYSRHSFRS